MQHDNILSSKTKSEIVTILWEFVEGGPLWTGTKFTKSNVTTSICGLSNMGSCIKNRDIVALLEFH